MTSEKRKVRYNPWIKSEVGGDGRVDIGIDFPAVARIDDKAHRISFDWKYFTEPFIVKDNLLGLGVTYTDIEAFAPSKAREIIRLWEEGSEKLGLSYAAPLIAFNEALTLLYTGNVSVKPKWGELITLLYNAIKNSCSIRGYEKKIVEIKRQLRGTARYASKSYEGVADLKRKIISFSTEALIASKLVDLGYSVEIPGAAPDLKIDGIFGEVKTIATPIRKGEEMKALKPFKLNEVILRAFQGEARLAFVDLSYSSSGWIGAFLPEYLTFENIMEKVVEVAKNRKVVVLTFHDGKNAYNLKAIPVII
jgi:hypothetical protein